MPSPSQSCVHLPFTRALGCHRLLCGQASFAPHLRSASTAAADGLTGKATSSPSLFARPRQLSLRLPLHLRLRLPLRRRKRRRTPPYLSFGLVTKKHSGTSSAAPSCGGRAVGRRCLVGVNTGAGAGAGAENRVGTRAGARARQYQHEKQRRSLSAPRLPPSSDIEPQCGV